MNRCGDGDLIERGCIATQTHQPPIPPPPSPSHQSTHGVVLLYDPKPGVSGWEAGWGQVPLRHFPAQKRFR
jgi:hypothetical protein